MHPTKVRFLRQELQQTYFSRFGHCFGPAANGQLAKYLVGVPFHCACRQKEAFCNVCIAQSGGNQAQNFHFSAGECFHQYDFLRSLGF